MSTPSQITANRSNAQHSTGPRTPEGKARVSQNAVTHGLSSRNVLLPGDDPSEYEALVRNLVVDHLPSTAAERALVQAIAENQWRLDRLLKWESDLMAEALTGDPSQPSRLLQMFSASGEPSDAIRKLHRYESLVRRNLMNSLKELRAQKSARHRANTVQRNTMLEDVKRMASLVRTVAREHDLPIPGEIDNSNPISTAPEQPIAGPIVSDSGKTS